MLSRKTLNTLLLGAVAMTIAVAAHAEDAAAPAPEKCYGVVKAGMNDCANASKTHSCAGHSTVDGGEEFVLLPAGACAKLVNGSVTAPGEAPAEAPAEGH